MSPFTLEICCYNLPSCLIAVEAGADRIELCMDPAGGGTTPSYGFIRTVREKTGSVRLFPIIRARGGDFFYSRGEYEVMARDIALCRDLGCDGVVIGGLTQEGNIDKENCARLMEAAGPMGVTFHRAFDRVSNPLDALEDVISLGCERILTSGARPSALEGADLLGELVRKAGSRLAIMPGGGVRAENIIALQDRTRAREFHSAALVTVPSMMQYINPMMGEQLTAVAVHSDEIRQMRIMLNQVYNRETA